MFSLNLSLTGLIARLFNVAQRPARLGTNDFVTETTGELPSIEFTSRCSTQTAPTGQSVVYILGQASSLPTTPAPAYTAHAPSVTASYAELFSDGLASQIGIGTELAMNNQVTRAVQAPGSTRRALRSLVRWNGRNVTGDVEMQLPVQRDERPPTYVEVEEARPVAPRRRGCFRMTILLVLSAIIASAITMVIIMKKSNAF